jgi:hypothetical protein
MHENREISCTSWSSDQDRSAKALNRTTDMNVQEKPDCAVVPANQPNKEEQSSAEAGAAQEQRSLHRLEDHGEKADRREAQSPQGRASTPEASSYDRSRCLASPSGAGLLPIPCRSGQLDSAAHLQSARLLVVAERSGPSQPTRPGAMGPSLPSLEPLDSATGFCTFIRWPALPPGIPGKSHMRQRARADLCGGRSAMVVPTATSARRFRRGSDFAPRLPGTDRAGKSRVCGDHESGLRRNPTAR